MEEYREDRSIQERPWSRAQGSPGGMQTGGQVLLGGADVMWQLIGSSVHLFSVRNEGKSPAESKDETGGDGVCVCVGGGQGSLGFEHHTALQALGLQS